MTYKPGQNSIAILAQNHTDKKLRKLHEAKLNNFIKEIGKFSAFLEEFEQIDLQSQELPKIDSIEDITKHEQFLIGRKFGFALIANGFDYEKYSKYKLERETKKHR